MKSDFKLAAELVKQRRKQSLKELVKAKKTPTEIAQVFGCSRQRVHQIAAECGVALYLGAKK